MMVFLIICAAVSVTAAILKGYYYGVGYIPKNKIERDLKEFASLIKEIDEIDPEYMCDTNVDWNCIEYCEDQSKRVNERINELSRSIITDSDVAVIEVLMEYRNTCDHISKASRIAEANNEFKSKIEKRNSEYEKNCRLLRNYTASGFEIESTRFSVFGSLSRIFILLCALGNAIVKTVTDQPRIHLWYSAAGAVLCMSLFVFINKLIRMKNEKSISAFELEIEQLERDLLAYKKSKIEQNYSQYVFSYEELKQSVIKTVDLLVTEHSTTCEYQEIINVVDIFDAISWISFFTLSML